MVFRNEEAVFHCQFSAKPPPVVEWLHESEPVIGKSRSVIHPFNLSVFVFIYLTLFFPLLHCLFFCFLFSFFFLHFTFCLSSSPISSFSFSTFPFIIFSYSSLLSSIHVFSCLDFSGDVAVLQQELVCLHCGRLCVFCHQQKCFSSWRNTLFPSVSSHAVSKPRHRAAQRSCIILITFRFCCCCWRWSCVALHRGLQGHSQPRDLASSLNVLLLRLNRETEIISGRFSSMYKYLFIY